MVKKTMKTQKQQMVKRMRVTINQLNKLNFNMKTVLTICMSLLLLAGAEAQKKPSINKAKALWEQGVLDEAKAMIDAATTYEKTMNDGKTWYYRGLIYASIDTTSNEAYQALEANALDVSLASFAKADELGEEGKDYSHWAASGLPVTKTQQIAGYYSYYFEQALNAYNEDDFVNASTLFETAAKILPNDTSAISNAGYAAQAVDDNDRALAMFNETLKRGANSLAIHQNIIGIYQQMDKSDEALNAIQEAKKSFPADNGLNRLEISILIGQGKQEAALNQLKNAIEKEPSDVVLRFVLGILYEELKDVDNALKAYDEALNIDPNHFESSFNKAVLVFNQANALYKEKGLLGYSAADQKKAKELDPKIKAGFMKAMPAWEKVYSIKPTDRSALESLVFIYAYLGEEKKADKVEAELNALGDDEGN
jgi:tetratricopeptide (TPR) repeat protein